MKKNIIKIVLICFISTLIGCGNRQPIVFSTKKEENLQKISQIDTKTVKEQQGNETTDLPKQEICYVHICGAIENPGVYELPQGSRLYELILLAGGLTGDAAVNSVNQAIQVQDGQQITILTNEEASGNGEGQTNQLPEQGNQNKININTASLALLTSLPGVGEGRAQEIIRFRTEEGAFKTIEDIKNVTGIKDGVFDKIKHLIIVK